MHVVIFAGGTVRPGKALFDAIGSAHMYIAADSGAATALQYGCTPHIVVGDFDSLEGSLVEELRKRGCEIRQAAVEKDETDTELAVQAAIDEGATRITLVGALGGERFDHEMANILLLAGFKDVPITLVDGPSICWLVRGQGNTAIDGKKGDLVSFLPLTGDASGIRTEGLYYALNNETLSFGRPRGVSNVLTGEHAVVSVEKGMLLVIYTHVEELNESAAPDQSPDAAP
ncbi:MAG TPA: thiamine diphosphokinase [Ktedonobacteraceae bacterium]|nr:thiamine diphosphokinase [Ktedonobacteraceae bacterium]